MAGARHRNYQRALKEADPVLRDMRLASAEAATGDVLRGRFGDWTQDPREVNTVIPPLAPEKDPNNEAYWRVGSLTLTAERPPMNHGWPTDVDPSAGV